MEINKHRVSLPFSSEESEILEKISLAAGQLKMEAFLVGGYVRDKILKRDSKDMDVTVIGSGIELAETVAMQFTPLPPIAVYKNFGTALLKYKDFQIEFVGARKESYRANSRKPIIENGNLPDDLSRRDFTINALAIPLKRNGETIVLDAFNGLEDLHNKVIRTPLDPDITFSDDPLRMMRAIRFATQLNFKINSSTFFSISSNKERIQIISAERISEELNKILLAPKPSIGFDLLFKCGLLEIIFPEFVKLFGVENYEGKGHKDNFYHTLQVLDNVAQRSDSLWLRWAALLHDIAKPETKRFEKQKGWTFHGHEVLGAKKVSGLFRKFHLPLNDKMKFVQKMVLLHLRPINVSKEEVTDSAIRRLLFDAGDDIDSLMILCESDITSKNQHKVRNYFENFKLVRAKLREVEDKDRMRNWQPPITGEIIMKTFNKLPGREIGTIKDAVREAILDGRIGNNYQEAFNFMLEKAKEAGWEAVNKKDILMNET
ncbi:MAG: HD domain-containing protein [Chitinophagales bacterium]|nr:HD domain-containing protein [Chitinophagales bacterium]